MLPAIVNDVPVTLSGLSLVQLLPVLCACVVLAWLKGGGTKLHHAFFHELSLMLLSGRLFRMALRSGGPPALEDCLRT